MSASRAWRAARAREITECARARSSALSARNARARAPQPMGGECECACMHAWAPAPTAEVDKDTHPGLSGRDASIDIGAVGDRFIRREEPQRS